MMIAADGSDRYVNWTLQFDSNGVLHEHFGLPYVEPSFIEKCLRAIDGKSRFSCCLRADQSFLRCVGTDSIRIVEIWFVCNGQPLVGSVSNIGTTNGEIALRFGPNPDDEVEIPSQSALTAEQCVEIFLHFFQSRQLMDRYSWIDAVYFPDPNDEWLL